ncbi:MAG TPA: putative molybdenum carrier protein [Chroococcales cyanobacterium]
MLQRIISGGQTGVDRAALDVAMRFNISHGGWCPQGRLAEDGKIALKYHLNETPAAEYDQRTEWNVRDADAVLILARGTLIGGTMLTKRIAVKLGRPYMIANPSPSRSGEIEPVILWLTLENISTLDIAGPRESQESGIYEDSFNFLTALFDKIFS